MGKTGETFLVGPDDLMRSDSRLFLEDPEAVQARRRSRRARRPTSPTSAIRQGGTTLVQPVDDRGHASWRSAASAAR